MKSTILPLMIAGIGIGSALAGDRVVETDAAPEVSAQPSLGELSRLTGDWSGARSWLEDLGITVDADYTSFYQGLMSGTGTRKFDHGGRADLFLDLDSSKLGLWEGGGLRTHTEYRFGNLNTNPGGVLWSVNTGQTLPQNAHEELTATSLFLTQQVGEPLTLMLGKINVVDLLAPSPFYGSWGTRRFMNLALVAPPTGLVPAVLMGGTASLRTDPLDWTLMVYDPHDRTRDYWPDDLFSDGVNISLSASHTGQLAGRTTIYGLGGIYTTQEGADLRDTLLPPGLVTTKKSGSFNVNADFTHFLVENHDRPGSGWGIFLRGGVGDGNPNPIQTYVSGGIGGNGLFSGRPNDTFGIGYFYFNFSDELKSGVRPELQFGDEQGAEVYYNFEVTPWFHLGADIQILDPATSGNSTAVVGGLRANIRF